MSLSPGDSCCAGPGYYDVTGIQEIMWTSKILWQEQHKQSESLPCPQPSPTAGGGMWCPVTPGSAAVPSSDCDHSADIQDQLFSLRGKANLSQLLLF